MITETKIEQLGFDLVKSYPHDDWHTNRFQKGVLQIEFTYHNETDKLETVDVTIDEVVGVVLSLSEIMYLDNILNKNDD